MSIPKYLEEHADHIDAAMFTGDTFHDQAARDWLRDMMARWERGLAAIEDEHPEEPEEPEEPDVTCPDCGAVQAIDTSPGHCENEHCIRA